MSVRSRDRASAVEDYLAHLGAIGSPHTPRMYGCFIRSLEEHSGKPPHRWRTADIERWMAWLRAERGNRPGTISVKVSAVHSLLRWMQSRGLVEDNVCALVDRPRRGIGVPRPAPQAVVDGLLADPNPAVRASATLAAYAGLRRAECCALRWSDLDPEGGWLYVMHGKGDKSARVPLHPRVARLARTEPRIGEHVVCQENGEPYGPDSLSNLLRPRMRALGMEPGSSLHTLRHWFATRALASGASTLAVQQAVRHATPDMTARYAQVAEQAVRDAVSAIA